MELGWGGFDRAKLDMLVLIGIPFSFHAIAKRAVCLFEVPELYQGKTLRKHERILIGSSREHKTRLGNMGNMPCLFVSLRILLKFCRVFSEVCLDTEQEISYFS